MAGISPAGHEGGCEGAEWNTARYSSLETHGQPSGHRVCGKREQINKQSFLSWSAMIAGRGVCGTHTHMHVYSCTHAYTRTSRC